jgi:hypothetical protein
MEDPEYFMSGPTGPSNPEQAPHAWDSLHVPGVESGSMEMYGMNIQYINLIQWKINPLDNY